jgi:hydroxyacylglutathione hydrolase
MPVATLAQLPVRDLHVAVEAGRAPAVLDVRTEAEWRQGHIPGSLHLPGGEVAARLGELPPGPLAVVCGAGYRSTVIASLLQRSGRAEVCNVTGGIGAWKHAGFPVETDSASYAKESTTRRTA